MSLKSLIVPICWNNRLNQALSPNGSIGEFLMGSASKGHKSGFVLGAPPIGFVVLFAAWFLLPISDWLQSFSTWAQSIGLLGLVLLSAAYVLGTLLLVPGVPMTLAVAVAYGWWALLICGMGGLLAALIAFLIGRFIARDLVKRFTQKHPVLKAIDSAAHEETFKTILLARLNPVTPFAMENYAFGVTGVPLTPYLLATLVGIVPGTIVNVSVEVTGRTAAQGETSAMNWVFLIAGLITTLILTVWMTRQAKQKLEQQKS
jgi:uncharacterized membrane protein YdjX (TVP38/TMEM64 family)